MKVSVNIITYNHERFIAQAIDSVLQQRTDFPFEILIGEDGSTDRTREIVKEFKARYPDRITLFMHDRDKGGVFDPGKWNFMYNVYHAKGDYMAVLDGDDYWTDPLKLQKQVDLLEAHPECTVCFTAAAVAEEGSGQAPALKRIPSPRPFYALADILHQNPFTSATMVYRNRLWDRFPAWFEESPGGFWPLSILCAREGKIAYIDEPTAVYRVHPGGIHSGLDLVQKYELMLRGREIVAPHLDPAHREILLASMYEINRKLLRLAWKQNNHSDVRTYARRCLGLSKYAKHGMVDRLAIVYGSVHSPLLGGTITPVVRAMRGWFRRASQAATPGT
jgi:glycosyltransferase involved in cell wall biosynthesis